MRRLLALPCLFLLGPLTVHAGEVDVIEGTAECDAQGRCQFSATLSHADTGWDHYADHWRVVVDGAEVARRVLHHPHVDEQPFTRSLGGVVLSPGTREITIQAHDSVHGYGGETLTIQID